MSKLLEKLNCNLSKVLNKAVLELDIKNIETRKEQENYLENFKKELNRLGYEVPTVLEDKENKGYYHIHIEKKNA